MTDPETGAASPGIPSVPPDADPAGAGASVPAAVELPISEGSRWRSYQIGAVVANAPEGTFEACDVTTMEEVVIHVRPITPTAPARRAAWDKLMKLPAGDFVKFIEAHEDDGFRYEITGLPPGSNLREWIACNQIGEPEIENLVRQLAVLIEAIHDAGVVHLQLRPDCIFIHETEKHLAVALGGMYEATLFEQGGRFPIAVDAYYAPPEAADVELHESGGGLCAWDWWSLGRVIQEIVLNRHVFDLLFDNGGTADPFTKRGKALALLSEKEPGPIRAGAVEKLPPRTSPRLRSLLRGLLTTVRDARWQAAHIQLWLQNEPAADRYDLPRGARLFVWNRHGFTLAEAAAYFCQPENFSDGVLNLFPEPQDRADTLVHFLREMPMHKADLERIEPLLALVDLSEWQQWPVAARRAAVAGLVWLSLVKPEARALRVRNWRIDTKGLQELLASASPEDAFAMINVLATEGFVGQVEPWDAGAAQALREIGASGLKIAQMAVDRGWIKPDETAALTRVLGVSLAPDSVLAAGRDRLRSTYARSRDPGITALLENATPSRSELVLLAYTGERAVEFDYITHADWNRQRCAELKARAAVLRGGVLWRRLHRAMAWGPALLGPWPVWLVIWSVPVAVACGGDAWGFAAVLALAAGVMRIAALVRVDEVVRRNVTGVAAWGWNDGSRRCLREARKILGDSDPMSLRELCDEYRSIGEEMAALPAGASVKQIPSIPRMTELAAGAGLATIVPAAVCVAALWGPGLPDRDTMAFAIEPLRRAVVGEDPDSANPPAEAIVRTVVEERDAAGELRLYEVIRDGFGTRRRGPLMRWDIVRGSVSPLSVARVVPIDETQAAHALVCGELLLEPYLRDDLDVTIAVRVPTGLTRAFGVALYRSGTGRLVDRNAYHLAQEPVEKQWYMIEGRRVVYLGEPPPLRLQNSLAQR